MFWLKIKNVVTIPCSQAYLEDLDDTLELEGSRSSSHLGYEYIC